MWGRKGLEGRLETRWRWEPTHPPQGPRRRAGAWGGSEARSLYLLENEGFHSSDEGHKRVKRRHSRDSQPRVRTQTPLSPGRGGAWLPAILLSASAARPACDPAWPRGGWMRRWAARGTEAGYASTAERDTAQPLCPQDFLTSSWSGPARGGALAGGAPQYQH